MGYRFSMFSLLHNQDSHPMKLWVDDERKMPEDFDIHAKSYVEALCAIQLKDITHVSLDHDLGTNPDGTLAKTGYDIIAQIERQIGKGGWWITIPTFAIHSANPVGRKNIQAAIDSIERMR